MKFENWDEVVGLKKRYDCKIREIERLNDLLHLISEGESTAMVVYVNGTQKARLEDAGIAKIVIDIRLREIESEVDNITEKLKEL